MNIDEQVLNIYRRQKVHNLIKEVSILWGGDDADFLHEYIAAVLQNCANDLQSAIVCFEELKQQALNLGKTMPAPKSKPSQESYGHKAFRKK